MTPWLKPSQPRAGSVSGAELTRLQRLGRTQAVEQHARSIGAGGDQAADVIVPADPDDAVGRQAGRGGCLRQQRAEIGAAGQNRRE